MHGADSVSVQGGRYESTNSGRYFVDKRPGVVLPPLTAAQVANPVQHGLATRHYVVSQYVRHPNLSSIQYSNFFNLVPNQSHDPCPHCLAANRCLRVGRSAA